MLVGLLLKLCSENGLTSARLLMESALMLCKTLPKFFFNFILLTRRKKKKSLTMTHGLCIPLCLFFRNGSETSLSRMIKSLGFLCGSNSQVYPCPTSLSLSLLPKPLANLLPRSLRNFLMLALNGVYALKLIFPKILRILWKSRLELKPSHRRCFT